MLNSHGQHSEKRDFIRIKAQTTMTFQIEDQQEIYAGITQDISGCGIAFETRQRLNSGDKIIVNVAAETKHFEPLVAHARVNRVDPKGSNQFIIACQIEKLL